MSEDPVAHVCREIGEDCIRSLAKHFYSHIPNDPLLGPMYPKQDLAGAEQRLADFLVMRLGGSMRYAETRGHPRLRMRHAPFHIGQAERDRWIQLMESSFEQIQIPQEIEQLLRAFLGDVASFLINATD